MPYTGSSPSEASTYLAVPPLIWVIMDIGTAESGTADQQEKAQKSNLKHMVHHCPYLDSCYSQYHTKVTTGVCNGASKYS
jgi:hypothetical protein